MNKKNNFYILLLAVIALAFVLPSPLVSSSDANEIENLPDDLTGLLIEDLLKIEVGTVYSASKFEQQTIDAPSSISIVTKSDIKQYGYRTLTDILNSLAGFYTSYDRNYNYIGARGFNRPGDYNSRVLLLIDGQRVNDNIYNTA